MFMFYVHVLCSCSMSMFYLQTVRFLAHLHSCISTPTLAIRMPTWSATKAPWTTTTVASEKYGLSVAISVPLPDCIRFHSICAWTYVLSLLMLNISWAVINYNADWTNVFLFDCQSLFLGKLMLWEVLFKPFRCKYEEERKKKSIY